ncbi:MAG TPA: SCO family protein [Rhodanobacteraceae bacterium]|nr:SCO family protein [Rhodanobacteraceae bacterium]
MRTLLLMLVVLSAWPTAAAAAATGPLPPKDLRKNATFIQRLGAQVAMDARFVSADGAPVTLRQVAGGKPLVLAMGYYHCPNLCGVVLDGMASGFAGINLEPGRDFEVAFISIDAHETPADALHKRRQLQASLPAAQPERWHMLTGKPEAIRAVADAIGYRYFYDPRIGQYAHAAGLVALTPAGKVSQYMFGVRYRPRPLRLAIVQASAGRLGTLVDQLVLLCCGYDPQTGRYSVLIGRVTAALCSGFALLMGGFVWFMFRRRPRGGMA